MSSGRARPYVSNRRHAVLLGVGAYVVGSFLLWDAYEHRGRPRPTLAMIWGGLV